METLYTTYSWDCVIAKLIGLSFQSLFVDFCFLSFSLLCYDLFILSQARTAALLCSTVFAFPVYLLLPVKETVVKNLSPSGGLWFPCTTTSNMKPSAHDLPNMDPSPSLLSPSHLASLPQVVLSAPIKAACLLRDDWTCSSPPLDRAAPQDGAYMEEEEIGKMKTLLALISCLLLCVTYLWGSAKQFWLWLWYFFSWVPLLNIWAAKL